MCIQLCYPISKTQRNLHAPPAFVLSILEHVHSGKQTSLILGFQMALMWRSSANNNPL